MTETQTFTIDIINIIPDDAVLFIQAPSRDHNSELKQLTKPSAYPFYEQIILSSENKKKLIDIVISEQIETYFQSAEFKMDDHTLFMTYDGMSSAQVSGTLTLPTWFRNKYLDILMVSKDW